MKVYLNRVTGIDDAIITMFISNGNWTRELEMDIRNLHDRVLDRYGRILPCATSADIERFGSLVKRLLNWGWKHITMLRFIDFSISVDGLHRGGQDDWDSHAMRFDNRIIRLSTRGRANTKYQTPSGGSTFGSEMSDFYKERILTTDSALAILGITAPDKIEYEGKTYVKCVNGYVLEEYANSPDALRGLYMLSMSSMFLFKINLTEWAHVYKERNIKGHANPEVKTACEAIADAIQEAIQLLDRELFEKIKN